MTMREDYAKDPDGAEINIKQTSLLGLNVSRLMKMKKEDVVVICMQREMIIQEKNQQLNDNIKLNDREEFYKMRHKIEELEGIIRNDSRLFPKLIEERNKAKNFEKLYHLCKVKLVREGYREREDYKRLRDKIKHLKELIRNG